MPRRPRVTVVGSLNFDLVARVTRFPRQGETVFGSEAGGGPGGKGGNQAVAAAFLGADVSIIARLGDDIYTERIREQLEDSGVDVDRIVFDKGECGQAQILVDDTGENQIVVVRGANERLEPGDIQLGAHDAVLCQLEIPVEVVAAAAAACEGMFCLNAAPATEIDSSLVDRCDLVVVNRYELESLPSTPKLTALTLGADGAILLDAGREIARAAPPKVDAVDGTAAGDAFTACLVVSHLEGREWDEALTRACAAGAIAASRFGAQPSLPTAEEVDEILAA